MEKEESLSKRKGCVTFVREMLIDNPTNNQLNIIFSNFYPIAIQDEHAYGFYDKLKMYGYSPHFREIEEGEIIPQYAIYIMKKEDGKFEFVEFKEIKTNII